MSHYAIIVATRAHDLDIDRWLAKNAAPESEVLRTSLTDDVSLTLISRDVHQKTHRGTFFIGLAIDHNRRSMAFGTSGWKRTPACYETAGEMLAGRFLALSWDERGLKMRRDFSGAVPVMETHGSGWYAFSDSLLILTDLRRAMGSPVTPNRQVMLARSRTLAISYQAQSSETVVRGVRFFPAGQVPRLRVDRAGAFCLDRTHDERNAKVVSSVADYRDTVRRMAGQIVG